MLSHSLIGDEGHEHAAGGELKQGRYIGSIVLESSKKKIAVISEFYLESPEDLTLFPSLHASFRMTLGGYNTHEYITEIFDDVKYDFDNGILTIDNPQNDLVVTGEVHTINGLPHIMGDVFIRSSAVFGKIELTFETDEPGGGGEPENHVGHAMSGAHNDDEPGQEQEEGIFISSLDGQYEGVCGNEAALIQLQTVRGLKTLWQEEGETSSLSRYYGISARIGLKRSVMCGSGTGKGLYCSLYNYGGGSYNFYLGKLVLRGPTSNDECSVEADTLKCEIRRTNFNRSCTFKKVNSPIKEVKFFPRKFNITPTPEQSKPLPPPDPPKSAALLAALRGTFAGYLHNETNDTYQLLKLHVMPFNFTENPHNPNQMMITTTATLHLGKDSAGPFVTQRYEPRSFYLRPGFTLSGPTTDTFINITEWKMGFIRGTLHSHAFGKVGTVQLIKANAPAAPSDMDLVRSFVGEFTGPVNASGVSASTRWFRFIFPAQPNDLTDHLIRFSGSYSAVAGITTGHNIDRGTFDPFTGNYGWILEKESAATFASGTIDKNNFAKMYWPPAPNVFGAYMTDYVPETFKRK